MEESIKKSAKPILIIWVISALCYLPLIAKGLTNSVDGCWAPTYFQAGNWELSIGRWAWLFFDKSREGYAAEPFNSLLTLLLISIASYIAISMFIRGKFKSYIYAMFILCSTAVCCYLSFRFNAPTFGMSVLLPTLAAFLITRETETVKKEILLLAVSSALIVVGLGLYQANAGFFGAIVIVYMMQLILTEKNKQCLHLFVKSLIAGAVGCVFYKIAWDICLKFRGISAASYRGADSVTVGKILVSLPRSIRDIYVSCLGFLFPIGHENYVFLPVRLIIVLAIIVLLLFVGIRATRKNVKNMIIFFLLILLLPLGANVSVILASGVDVLDIQMTGPMTMIIPIVLCLIENVGFRYDKLLGVLGALLLYGNVYAVGIDIDAMAQGSNSSYAIMNGIVNTLEDEDALSGEYQYAFYGNISKNELFRVNELYYRADWFARFGDMIKKFDMDCNTYSGILDDIGIDIDSVSLDLYEEIYNSGVLDEMPAYPAKGSIIKGDGYVVVKVSEDYIH